MKSKKLITAGVAIGAIVALFLIPKTRKVLSDALCNLTGSLKNAMNKAEDIIAEA